MQIDIPTPERIFELSQEMIGNFKSLKDERSLSDFKSINDFAHSNGISLSTAQFYLLAGATNFHKLDDTRFLFAAVTPTQVGEILNLKSKSLARRLANLAEKGLLTRETNGAYRISDVHQWLELSKSITLTQ